MSSEAQQPMGADDSQNEVPGAGGKRGRAKAKPGKITFLRGFCGVCNSKCPATCIKVKASAGESVSICGDPCASVIEALHWMTIDSIRETMVTNEKFEGEVKATIQNAKAKCAPSFDRESVRVSRGTRMSIAKKALGLNANEFEKKTGKLPNTRTARYHPTMVVPKRGSAEKETVWLFTWEPGTPYREVLVEQFQETILDRPLLLAEEHVVESQGHRTLAWSEGVQGDKAKHSSIFDTLETIGTCCERMKKFTKPVGSTEDSPRTPGSSTEVLAAAALSHSEAVVGEQEHPELEAEGQGSEQVSGSVLRKARSAVFSGTPDRGAPKRRRVRKGADESPATMFSDTMDLGESAVSEVGVPVPSIAASTQVTASGRKVGKLEKWMGKLDLVQAMQEGRKAVMARQAALDEAKRLGWTAEANNIRAYVKVVDMAVQLHRDNIFSIPLEGMHSALDEVSQRVALPACVYKSVVQRKAHCFFPTVTCVSSFEVLYDALCPWKLASEQDAEFSFLEPRSRFATIVPIEERISLFVTYVVGKVLTKIISDGDGAIHFLMAVCDFLLEKLHELCAGGMEKEFSSFVCDLMTVCKGLSFAGGKWSSQLWMGSEVLEDIDTLNSILDSKAPSGSVLGLVRSAVEASGFGVKFKELIRMKPRLIASGPDLWGHSEALKEADAKNAAGASGESMSEVLETLEKFFEDLPRLSHSLPKEMTDGLKTQALSLLEASCALNDSCTPAAGHRAPDTWRPTPDPGAPTPNTGHRTPDTERPTPDTEPGTPNAGRQTPDNGHRTPHLGSRAPQESFKPSSRRRRQRQWLMTMACTLANWMRWQKICRRRPSRARSPRMCQIGRMRLGLGSATCPPRLSSKN